MNSELIPANEVPRVCAPADIGGLHDLFGRIRNRFPALGPICLENARLIAQMEAEHRYSYEHPSDLRPSPSGMHVLESADFKDEYLCIRHAPTPGSLEARARHLRTVSTFAIKDLRKYGFEPTCARCGRTGAEA